LAAGLVAMGWAGCADNKNPPPSYKDPVAPAIPEPNTNPSMNHQQPVQPEMSTPPAPPI
jgi:hypothetical protein